MGNEIISLTCPNCGSSDNIIENNIHFGYEFKCKNCATTSVLVINNRLYVPSPGEKICLSCGRVAERNSRFCQCGKSLIRKCISPECLKEFPVDHNICDYCGWPQNVEPSSPQGKNFLLDQYLLKIGDPDHQIASFGYISAKKLLESEDEAILKHALDIYIRGDSLGQNLIQEIICNASINQIKDVIFPALNKQRDNRRYEDLAYLFCICRDNKTRKLLGELIANEGVEFIPAIINRIEILPNNLFLDKESIRGQAIIMFTAIGRPALPYLENVITNSNISPQLKYDISEAIKKIKRKR